MRPVSFSLSLWERAGVRARGLSIEQWVIDPPLALTLTLSQRERG
jgi:hypothetical protein